MLYAFAVANLASFIKSPRASPAKTQGEALRVVVLTEPTVGSLRGLYVPLVRHRAVAVASAFQVPSVLPDDVVSDALVPWPGTAYARSARRSAAPTVTGL